MNQVLELSPGMTQNPYRTKKRAGSDIVEHTKIVSDLALSSEPAEFELSRLWLDVWKRARGRAEVPTALALTHAPDELRDHLAIHLTLPTEHRFSGSQAKLLETKLSIASETMTPEMAETARSAFHLASENAQPTLTRMKFEKAKLVVETLILPAQPSLKGRGMCVSSVVFKPLTGAMSDRAAVEAARIDVP
ncbi:MAG: hypothetical protein NXH87_17975 [Rhodobiaceae bacterium]|nr:hypothetical protein [Rhodobiaceae bacterium]